jgi:DNA-binding response OmpR family regulator
MPSRRILYVGSDLALLKSLSEALKDCHIVRALDGSLSRVLMQSEIRYSLLLIDEKLPDTEAVAFARFARKLPHHEGTPIIILSANEAPCNVARVYFARPGDYGLLSKTIRRRLDTSTLP